MQYIPDAVDFPPSELLDLQCKFSMTIEKSNLHRQCNSSDLENPEADSILCLVQPGLALSPSQRILIYCDDYWERLLEFMRRQVPFLVGLLGSGEFDRVVGIPYLRENPSTSWACHLLSQNLYDWMDRNYRGQDRDLLLKAVKIDLVFSKLAAASYLNLSNFDGLDQVEIVKIFESSVLCLPSTVELNSYDCNLLSFRAAMLDQHTDYWIDHPFPLLERYKNYFFVIFKHQNGQVHWTEVSKDEYTFLEIIREGITLEGLANTMESPMDRSVSLSMGQLVQLFQKWISKNWVMMTTGDAVKRAVLGS